MPPKARRHKQTNEPRFDARTPLSRMAGVDLTTLEGIEEGTALVMRSAIGTDMTRWPSVKHCCRWLGLCPQHNISGGKVRSRRVRPGAHRVTVALRLAARSLHHSQSALGAFFRRMKARLGSPKASTAAAHKLARLVSYLLKHGSAYVQQGLENYAAQYHERKVKTMAKQAKALGYTLVPLVAQGYDYVPGPRRSRLSSHNASHALRATGRKGSGAGLCPAPHDSHPHPSTGAHQRRPPLPRPSSPFSRRSSPSSRKP